MAILQITSGERRALRARAHALRPVVMVSDAGVTPPVLNEIERSLAAHELIKIRVSVDAREERDAMLHSICEELSAASVQHLGKMLVLYRPRPPDEGGPKKAPRPRRRPPRRTKRSYQR